MITPHDLDQLEAHATLAAPASGLGPNRARNIAQFESAAAPYRALARSARSLLASGRTIGPELEEELRRGARHLAAMRRRLGLGRTTG